MQEHHREGSEHRNGEHGLRHGDAEQHHERHPDQIEHGDDPPVAFSFLTGRIERSQIDCYLLHTNDRVRDLVQGNISQSPLFNGASNGNTTYPAASSILVFDYEIGELGAEFNTQIGALPLQLWANYAQNMASDVEEDTAYNVGVRLGRASNPRTWEAAAMYQSIDKDALFGQFIDSDFGNGNTDTEGWALRGAYAPVRNIAVNLTYFINTLNKDVGTELDYDRLQLDFNWKY